MATKRYVALAHRGETGTWGVSFPDFPGCIGASEAGFDEALADAITALAAHVAWMKADGDPIPEPRDVEALRADPELEEEFEDAVVTMLPLLPPEAELVRINLSMDRNLVGEIDQAAKKRGMTRSGYLAELAKQDLVHTL
ncbi:MAG: type II toxin-antitoxin system HicB family antitoxin [Verrucomicrobiota bacterium]|nr:type II toxin-antitoxin system HicB family antitoxin [Verrucomicrobiota bacterium]